ncbi:GNAT family N-acetyltransferase [Mariniphaga sediminis]|uniref:GNAT family N-acetyltransferase n=1 Tax=Mariniphaga sediminis TaxID=1628158 RepID=UPI00356A6BB7
MKIWELKTFQQETYRAVLALTPQLGEGIPLPTEEHFKQILESQNSHLFLAEKDEEIVGMFTVGTYVIPTGKRVWIEDVVVDQKHTGKGHGKQLILEAIRFAESIGAVSVELTSRPSRVAANKLYQRVGFVKQETNKYRYILK